MLAERACLETFSYRHSFPLVWLSLPYQTLLSLSNPLYPGGHVVSGLHFVGAARPQAPLSRQELRPPAHPHL